MGMAGAQGVGCAGKEGGDSNGNGGGGCVEEKIIIGGIIIWGRNHGSNQKYVQVEFTENGPERALVVGVSQKSERNQKAIHDVDTGHLEAWHCLQY